MPLPSAYLDGRVLAVKHVLQFASYDGQRCRVQVGGGENLIELSLLLLEGLGQSCQLLLKEQVLEVGFLLNLMNGLRVKTMLSDRRKKRNRLRRKGGNRSES